MCRPIQTHCMLGEDAVPELEAFDHFSHSYRQLYIHIIKNSCGLSIWGLEHMYNHSLTHLRLGLHVCVFKDNKTFPLWLDDGGNQ